MRRALVLAVAAAGAMPAAAEAARSPVAYDVTARVEIRDEWAFHEHAATECFDGTCVSEEKASGRQRLQLRTRRPQRVYVTRGRRPMIDGELQLAGAHLQVGTHEFLWSGPWDEANPDYAIPADDCGNRPVRTTISFHFTARNRLAPSLVFDDLRESCPVGIPRNGVWDGDQVPSMFDVVASVQQSKFGRTRQFTVTGVRAWHEGVEPGSEHVRRTGARDVRYLWEVTFRKAKAKRKRRG